MSFQAYLAFVAACIALALLPGPVVTLLIANGLRHGTRAALISPRVMGSAGGRRRSAMWCVPQLSMFAMTCLMRV